MSDYDDGKITDRERAASKKQKEIFNYSDKTLTGVADYNTKSAQNVANWNESQQNKLANKNAANTTSIAEYNAAATANQLAKQLANYDLANAQNANMRNTQFKQASRKTEAERFEAQRNLQNAALGLFGSMNQAMNGSTLGNTMYMLNNRNDAENSTHWQQLMDNRNAIQNAYDESYNQNQIAKRDAAINALKALQDIQGDLSSNLNNVQGDLYANLTNIRGDLLANLSNIQGDLYANRRNLRSDLAANLNNINPNLYEAPGALDIPTTGYNVSGNRIGSITDSSGNLKDTLYKAPGSNAKISGYEKTAQNNIDSVKQHNATLLDYIMPANAEQNVRKQRNRLLANDYFSKLMNRYNNR